MILPLYQALKILGQIETKSAEFRHRVLVGVIVLGGDVVVSYLVDSLVVCSSSSVALLSLRSVAEPLKNRVVKLWVMELSAGQSD